jgi:hypothetical protein
MRIACVLLLAACGSSTEPAASDAPLPMDAPDTHCDLFGEFLPIVITGTSPAGPLDPFRFVRASHSEGGCSDAYGIALITAPPEDGCLFGPTLSFMISAPYDQPSIQTITTLSTTDYYSTNQVWFEVTQLDPPTVPMGRIQGHFVSHDPAWTFDIAVDLISQYNTSCL